MSGDTTLDLDAYFSRIGFDVTTLIGRAAGWRRKRSTPCVRTC